MKSVPALVPDGVPLHIDFGRNRRLALTRHARFFSHGSRPGRTELLSLAAVVLGDVGPALDAGTRR